MPVAAVLRQVNTSTNKLHSKNLQVVNLQKKHNKEKRELTKKVCTIVYCCLIFLLTLSLYFINLVLNLQGKNIYFNLRETRVFFSLVIPFAYLILRLVQRLQAWGWLGSQLFRQVKLLHNSRVVDKGNRNKYSKYTHFQIAMLCELHWPTKKM